MVCQNSRAVSHTYYILFMISILNLRLEAVQPAYADFNGTMYAGTIPSNHDDRRGEMMFWLFEPETQAIPDTIVLWLNGGPGKPFMSNHAPGESIYAYACMLTQLALSLQQDVRLLIVRTKITLFCD